MATRFSAEAWLRRAACEADSRPDAQLLQQFLRYRDEDAFAVLVRRHGPTVLGVCRRLLRDGHDVEDAFQATFLVLVRKARSISHRDRLGGWLYGVAFRTAQKARFRRARQQAVERSAEGAAPDFATSTPTPNEWFEVLDRELLAVPEKYRLPILLCELRGIARRDAARQLGLAEGTLSSRLARGRQLLRQRLARRGITLSASALLIGLASQAQADFSPALVGPTSRSAACDLANRSLAGGVVPAGVLTLTEGVIQSMFQSKLRLVLLVLPVLALAAWGFHAASAKAPPVREAAHPADSLPPPVQAKPALNPTRAVALIFDDIPISREELGEFLIARYGKENVERLVNRRIVEHFTGKNGITVTEKEIDDALSEDLAQLRVNRGDFVSKVLKAYGKTLYEWREDVIRPKLMLGKLCRRKLTVSEEEMHAQFESLFGKKARCKVIVWPKESGRLAAWRAYQEIRHTDEEAFDRVARQQPNAMLAAAGGEIPPIGLLPGDETLPLKDVFAMKPGELSPLLTAKDGSFVIIKCLGFIPPDRGRIFEKERPRLMKEVLDRKIAAEIPRQFQEFRTAARPKILLKSTPAETP
jgi:RNA polymerase sigma factor (sigma-70 family)